MIRKATVEGGVVRGIPAADPRITSFKGIPFAAPPVGPNRWRAPQSVIPWEGELPCLTFKPISMQHIPGLDKDNIYSREWNVDPEIPMDEDCLYLNVWTPAKTPGEKLPVFVWYFGGDPDNITIGGQSAGGGSVCAQLTSPQNEGLFQRAIIQSGIMAGVYNTFFPGAKRTFADAEEQGVKFFDFLGVKTLEEARAIDAKTLRDKCEEFKGWFGTTSDGVFQTGEATDNMMRGKRYPVPLMITRTMDEFASGLMANTKEEFEEKARAIFGDRAGTFLRICTGEVGEKVKRSFVNGLEIAVNALVRQQKELGPDTPVYYAVFDAEIPGWDNPGTFHSVDLWFYFETLAKCWRPFVGKHYDLSRKMCNYWANFIRCGDPNGSDADGTPMPRWEPLKADAPYAMIWGDTVEISKEKPDELVELCIETYRDGLKAKEG